MSLRCRPGDLAVLVRSAAGNEGKIVRCLRLASAEELWRYWFVADKGLVWVIDRALTCSHGFECPLALDRNLRPIRDNPGEDEMLSIARKNAHDSAITEQQERLTRLLEEVPKQ